MAQYIEFASNHLYLFLALAALLVMLVMSFLGDRLRGFESRTPIEAVQLINREDALVLDVREDNEYKSGHVVNSLHIPLGSLAARMKELEKYKARPIVVGCRSGNRSGQACSTLKKQGFDKVYNLRGGIMAWQSDNLPVSKD